MNIEFTKIQQIVNQFAKTLEVDSQDVTHLKETANAYCIKLYKKKYYVIFLIYASGKKVEKLGIDDYIKSRFLDVKDCWMENGKTGTAKTPVDYSRIQ